MKRQDFAIVALAAMFGLASPASSRAQGRGGTPVGTAEARGGGGGESGGGGSAVPRSGGDSGSSAGTSSGGASSSSSTPSTPSMNPSYIPPSPSAEPVSYAPQRRGGGGGGNSGGGGGQAVPRGSAGSGSGGGEGARSGARAPSGTTTSSAGANENGGDHRAVPTYSRPRGEHPVTGEAVQRQGPRPGSGGDINVYPSYPYYGYYPYYGGYWGSGYGYGLGYMYDPFWSPFGYGGGYGGGYGYGDPYGGYYVGGASGGYGREAHDTGSLRLKIKPREAQVYVDGYLVGDVDSFDGAFQKLGIESGGHRVELKADGYEPIQFDVLITAGETVTYKGELKPIK